jgi:hypothetical protein
VARIRNIKPDFFTDAELCDLSPLHRLLFQALWCQADRDGILEDKPRELKVKCLPFDDCDVEGMLWDLHSTGFIVRYEVGGERLIHIQGFATHQKFHRDEKPRGLPTPDLGTVRAPCQHPADTLPARGATSDPASDTKVPPRASTPDIGCLTSDVGTPEPLRVAVGSANSVSSMSGTNAPGVARAAVGVVDGGETLEEGIKRIWLKKRGKPWVWLTGHEQELRPAFDMAGGDVAEVLRVFEAALDKTYPRLTKLRHLAEHWNDYAATRGPEPRAGNPNARATDADRFGRGYEPPLTASGSVDLLAGGQ